MISLRFLVLVAAGAIPVFSAAKLHTKHAAHWDVGGIDYLWDDSHSKADYVSRGAFVLAKNEIAGIKSVPGKANEEVFVTVPRWLAGVPSTLNKVSLKAGTSGGGGGPVLNPVLTPWPSWEANEIGDCSALQYLQSMEIDNDGQASNQNDIEIGQLEVDEETGQVTMVLHADAN